MDECRGPSKTPTPHPARWQGRLLHVTMHKKMEGMTTVRRQMSLPTIEIIQGRPAGSHLRMKISYRYERWLIVNAAGRKSGIFIMIKDLFMYQYLHWTYRYKRSCLCYNKFTCSLIRCFQYTQMFIVPSFQAYGVLNRHSSYDAAHPEGHVILRLYGINRSISLFSRTVKKPDALIVTAAVGCGTCPT